jgi:hypothetical protein
VQRRVDVAGLRGQEVPCLLHAAMNRSASSAGTSKALINVSGSAMTHLSSFTR